MAKYLTRTVFTLSFVSLFADVASEMLYPVMPFYLKSIGFTALSIGVLEGFAQFIIGFSTGYFGSISDSMGKRMPFVRTGYLLSAVSKSMMALFVNPAWVFFSRFVDRLGKGIRTGARDAMLSGEAQNNHKGKVFGFHRAMDTFGAAIGPVIALVYLIYNPGDYKSLFIIAFGPGLLSVAITFLVKEKKVIIPKETKARSGFFSFLAYWKRSSKAYKQILTGLLICAIVNSSDAFLFLAAKSAGMKDNSIIGAYIFYNVVYAGMAFPAGWIADKIGMKRTFSIGLLLFAVTYAGMSLTNSILELYIWFFSYGLYAAFTEGVANAWLSNNSSNEERGTALGLYKSAASICLLLASVIAGLLWTHISPFVALVYSSIGALVAMFYFMVKTPKLV
jgi:MFS family permease